MEIAPRTRVRGAAYSNLLDLDVLNLLEECPRVGIEMFEGIHGLLRKPCQAIDP